MSWRKKKYNDPNRRPPIISVKRLWAIGQLTKSRRKLLAALAIPGCEKVRKKRPLAIGDRRAAALDEGVVTDALGSVTPDTCRLGNRMMQSLLHLGAPFARRITFVGERMAHRVCPWWLGYFLISPLRRLRQNPTRILVPYVREGQTVLEPGPGMGFFTLDLARLVGASGRVVVVDIQPKMLERLKRRAAKAALLDRIDVRLASPDSMGITELAGSIDFTLAFAVVHEMQDASRFFREVAEASKPGAILLLAEPKGHVKECDFDSELQLASKAGFELVSRPTIGRSYAAVLKKV